VTVAAGPCPSASEERGKGDCNVRYGTTQNDGVRRRHFGEEAVRLVAGPTGSGAHNHGREGQGALRGWRGVLGRTKSTEIVIPDLEEKGLQNGKATVSPLRVKSVRQCKELHQLGTS
jgi:hypothetical protein